MVVLRIKAAGAELVTTGVEKVVKQDMEGTGLGMVTDGPEVVETGLKWQILDQGWRQPD